jgi:hypothetical protein
MRVRRRNLKLVLRQLYRRLQGYRIWLYFDGAVWHRGDAVTQFLHTHPRLCPRYLPPYQPGPQPPGTPLAARPLRSHHELVVPESRRDLGPYPPNHPVLVAAQDQASVSRYLTRWY